MPWLPCRCAGSRRNQIGGQRKRACARWKSSGKKLTLSNPRGLQVSRYGKLCLGYLAAAQAAGANPHALVAGLGLGMHRAQIDVPAPPRDVMRVTDVVTELRAFAADFTDLCHK